MNKYLKSLLPKDKRGVMGLGTAKGFLLGLLSLVLIAVSMVIVLVQLDSSGAGNSQTSQIINNTTVAAADLFGNVGTWLTLLSVVIIILIIAGVIVVINRFDQTATGERL